MKKSLILCAAIFLLLMGLLFYAEHSSLAAPPDLLPRNRIADDLARK